ncbi:DUF4760 domain-containing protein [Nocardia goodfellowii]|uniref:Uncharacterized protein n=1 Tax=Nocardia goodfellowii TaxID=882446 RepID=A0ABS4QI55_9NOCA|nr:hypothetical protein [Nocardia goodfellowii]MBP2191388.1 hypothetical protein [Nocardia goodfellowii]
MDATILVSALAVVVSVAAMVVSIMVGTRQARLAKDANQLPAVINLLTEFRSVAFHDNYHKVISELDPQNPSSLGISDLPEDLRAAVVDIGYYFQTFASLFALGILDEASTMVMLHHRFVAVWEAIAPYAAVERAKPYSDGHNLAMLEFYANRARAVPIGAMSRLLRRDETIRLARQHLRRAGSPARLPPPSGDS